MVTTPVIYADPQRVPFVDIKTGKLTREGFLFLRGLRSTIPSDPEEALEALQAGLGDIQLQPPPAEVLTEMLLQPPPASVVGPIFRARANAGTALAAGVSTKINLQIEDFDTSNAFASSRFSPTTAGYYRIGGAVGSAGATTYLIAQLAKNGALYCNGAYTTVGATAFSISTVDSIVFLNGVGDYVELFAQSAAAQTTSTNGTDTYLSGAFLRSN